MEKLKTFFECAIAVPSACLSLVEAFGPNSELTGSIERLEATLVVASQLIERSECWCFRYDSIRKLLSCLKDAVYEAELTIEEFKSQRRRAESHDQNIASELINNFHNWRTGFKEQVISGQGNLDHFCGQLEKICNSHEIPQNPKKFSRPITVSRPPDVLYGRDKELNDAISKLGNPRSSLYAGKSSSCTENKRKIPVLPIVGIGGVGKTTLSQMVYKDKRVQSYYDLKIWTCVAEKFDLERMLKEILQCATRVVCNFTNLDLLQDTLVEAVKSKRVLLVLDDIWSADWQQLLGPMNEASEGSAIMLTTRSRDYFINCTDDNMTLLEPILLEGLEQKIYWEFFKRCAGLKVDSANYSELEPIASTICSRLDRLPLAAKTVGGVLSQRIDRQHWISIRDSEMWKVKQGKDGSPQVPASLSPGVQTRAQTRRLSGQGVVIGGVRGEYRVEEGSGKGKEKVVGKKAEEFANLKIAAKESRAQRFNEQNQVSGRGLSSQQPISNTDNTGALGAAGPSSSGTTMLIDQTPITGTTISITI
ncbi:hypothetical protein LUZ61_009060 [Rhynchospora tenuis]|uniref:NB-ARC domain-containing protein n=1 Tax=Rhynchospora tenuis TaxID=198213 RepID=A0AAD6EY74_9POAL|nr:hypothetical protein LUZ61_009060 [Rhynchospora tenuis]